MNYSLNFHQFQSAHDSMQDNTNTDMLLDKNLLVIAHRYSAFTKEQIDEIAKSFDSVTILVRYNRITDLSKYVSHPSLKRFGTDMKIAAESPDNVKVIETPILYLPTNLWLRYLGRHHMLKINKLLDRHEIEFDIIHAHFTWTSGYTAARLKERYNVPYVLTVHENEERLEEELYSGNEDLYRAWEDADAIIRVNKKDCKHLQEFNDNVYHIPNGFSQDRLPNISQSTARRQLDIPEETELVFSLGSLIPRKQFELLIKAIDQLDHRDNLKCVIGGHGKLKSELEKLIHKRELENKVNLTGYIDEKNLKYWMNACDVFSLVSRAEGNPTVMFEALGCGSPYVGTDVGGVNEIITSKKYGLLCEASEEDISRKIEIGLEKDWDFEKIYEYSLNYTWEKIADRITNIYINVLCQDE